MEINEFIRQIPKAELHIHIEGSFEPELMFEIARRNGLKIKFDSVEDIRAAYHFNNLQEFLDIYYEGAGVLLHEQDFYDLTWAYMSSLPAQGVRHTEIFFDPQTHTHRGVAFDTVIKGIRRALEDAEAKLGVSSKLILCFLRHLSEEDAFKTLAQAAPYREWIIGVGLDSSEVGNPPSKFERVFRKAQEEGYLPVAHAGEEGPAEYIWEAIKLLKVQRIDHGNRCLDDESLVKELVARQTPLTVCPLSNIKLCVVDELRNHPMKILLEKGLCATINSDDPAYFGGNLHENFIQTAEAVGLTQKHVVQLAKNSFIGSFLSDAQKAAFIREIEEFREANA